MSHSYENLPASRFMELEHALFDLDVLSNQLTAAANALPLDLINLQRLASSAVTFAYNLQSEINDAIDATHLLSRGVPLAENFSNGSRAPELLTPRQVLYLAAHARREMKEETEHGSLEHNEL
jgi:hypothetical protein